MACEICKKPYIPAADDRSFDSNEKPHVCNICGKSFSLKIQLKRHVLSHEEDVPYICNTCEKHLEQSSYNLRLSKKGNFTCDTCNKCFPSKKLLLRHASEHISETSLSCDECGESFKNVTALKKHAVVHKIKKNSSKGSGRNEASGVPYECDDCGKGFSQLKQLSKHQLIHKYNCDACGMNFTLSNLLVKHQASGTCRSDNNNGSADSTSADNLNSSTSDDKKHVCDICNKSFTRKSALDGHIPSHFTDSHESPIEDDDTDVDADFECTYKGDKSGEPPKRQCLPKLKIRRSFPCEKCDIVCASKKTYDRHVASHEKIQVSFVEEEKKIFTCRICNETFDTKENYKKHKLHHESKMAEKEPVEKEKKTYTCQLCKNVFCKRRHLRKHIKCHFNIDPNETSSLSSEDIQMGKRPKRNKRFACSFCGKLFAGETCLKKHEVKHTDDSDSSKSRKDKTPKKLVCNFCNEDFTGRKHNYIKHKLNHTPEVCGICDARFVDRASLREHCRIHIGTEEGRRFIECSQKALDAKNGVVQPDPKVEYIYLVLR